MELKTKPSPPDKDPFQSPFLRWAQSVLKLYQSFRKGKCTAMDKVRAIRDITNILSSASPLLTNSELNNSIETYLQIFEQHQQSLATARSNGMEQSETADVAGTREKRAVSPTEYLEVSKRQKVDEKDFPWTIQEMFTSPGPNALG